LDAYLNYIMTFAIAFIVAFFTTPLARKLALKLRAVDVPKEKRRVHKRPIPRLGGLAILAGFLMAISYYFTVVMPWNGIDIDKRILGLLLGIAVIEIGAIWDDIKPIKAHVKLLFQIVAAAIVVAMGVRIEQFTNPFVPEGFISLGYLSVPITMLWIVGVTNAINFIDGLDGLAAGIASISSISLLLISIYLGQIEVIILTAALAGAALGFLPFNFHPARIFMGETGSAFLGFTLGVVSIIGLVKSYAVFSILVPVVVLALPIFDTAFAIIRRLLTGKSPMQADRGHLHHRLVDSGLSQKQTVLTLYLISAFFGLSALVLVETGIFKALLLILAVAVFVVGGMKYMGEMKNRID